MSKVKVKASMARRPPLPGATLDFRNAIEIAQRATPNCIQPQSVTDDGICDNRLNNVIESSLLEEIMHLII